MDRIYGVGARTERTGRNKCHVVYGGGGGGGDDDDDDDSRKSGDVT